MKHFWNWTYKVSLRFGFKKSVPLPVYSVNINYVLYFSTSQCCKLLHNSVLTCCWCCCLNFKEQDDIFNDSAISIIKGCYYIGTYSKIDFSRIDTKICLIFKASTSTLSRLLLYSWMDDRKSSLRGIRLDKW